MEPPTNPPDLWQGTLSAHRAQTSERIMRAAMGIIARDGIAALSMSALAGTAGVSRQTLYKYFPDVDAVLAEMATMGSAGMVELSGRIDAEPDPRDGLRVFVAAILESAARGHPSPLALASAVPAATRESVREHEEAAEAMVIELLRRGRETGAFRGDLDPELDGQLIYRAAFSVHDLAAAPGVDLAALTSHVTADFLRIVEAPAASQRLDR